MDLARPARTGTSTPLEKTRKLSKRQLEIRLSKLSTSIPDPNILLEQYPVSTEVAAELLYMAGFEHDDIQDRNILDLGTGTGRLAIGAALLGAKTVVGIDLDAESIRLGKENAARSDVLVNWQIGRIEDVSDTYDTVLMNPPYGTRVEHADTIFLDKAFESAPIVYTIHKSSTRPFVSKYVEKHDRRVDSIRKVDLRIPYIYNFHRKRWSVVQVDIFRIVR